MNAVPPDNEPTTDELETLADDEERDVVDDPAVPNDVRTEVLDEIDRHREADIDVER